MATFGKRGIVSCGVVEPPTSTILAVNGYFSTLNNFGSGGFAVFSEIQVPEGAGLVGISWRWDVIRQHEVMAFVNPDVNDVLGVRPFAVLQTTSGGVDTYRCWIKLLAADGNINPGNVHYRFEATDGTNTLRSKCRIQAQYEPHFDTNWNTVGYVPAWIDNAALTSSNTYNADGVV